MTSNFQPSTWRALLQSLLESSLKEHLVKSSGLHVATLDRWVKGLNKPRPETLRSLVLASGEYQEVFLELIRKEYPTFSVSEQPLTITLKREEQSELSLYRDTMRVISHTPSSQRYWTVQNLILEHMLAVLAPACTGIGIGLMQCLALEDHNERNVMCLRSILRRATPPWTDDYSPKLFVGSESLSGRAVETRRSVTCQDIHEGIPYAVRQESNELEESVAALPIFSELKVAGCIVVNCMNAHFFSEERMRQLEEWADLLSLGFPPEAYFAQNEIALKKMPSEKVQEKHFANFQDRVLSFLGRHAQTGERLTQLQAEKLVWKQLASEMSLATPANVFPS